jgi:nucleoside-specific outer membrane channel protein Tsx
MLRRSLALAAVLVASATGFAGAADLPVKAPKAVSPPPFFFVNDNSLELSYRWTATDPGVGRTAKTVVSFYHFDVWAYGTNFFTVSWLKSRSNDPANIAAGAVPGVAAGAAELYGLFRSTFGLNQILNTKAFAIGPLTNVSLAIGADANANNGGIGSGKTDIVAGLDFSFALPYNGHLDISPLYYKEWQHNAFAGIPSQSLSYNGTWAVETVWSLPLGFLPPSIPLTLGGYANFYGPKGDGGALPAVANKTITEFHSETRLALDVGKVMGGRPGMLSVFTGYRYWKNKFGIDPIPNNLGFTVESTWIAGATIAF